METLEMWKHFLLGIGISLMLGCAAQNKDPPYYGLNKNSYGVLSTRSLKYCGIENNPSLAPGIDAASITTAITDMIMSPLRKTVTIDDTLRKEELTNHFKAPGDFGAANVAIISRTPDEIIFWHSLNLVPLSEVKSAADEYCSRENCKSLYEGSSEQCSETTKEPMIMNGQQVSISVTQTISAFRCVAE